MTDTEFDTWLKNQDDLTPDVRERIEKLYNQLVHATVRLARVENNYDGAARHTPAWKQARNEALEEAAETADNWDKLVPGLTTLHASHWRRAEFASETIADAIRALKDGK